MDQLILSALKWITICMGRAALWLVSGGRWRGESLTGDEGRVHSAAGSLWFERDGRTVFTHTAQLFAGVVVWVVAILGSFAIAVVV